MTLNRTKPKPVYKDRGSKAKRSIFLLSLLFCICFGCSCVGHEGYEVALRLHQAREGNPVVLGRVEGDRFIALDTCVLDEGRVRFLLSEDDVQGVYRFNLGQTLVAEVMNEPAQLLDFVFNREQLISLETDFLAPVDSVQVLVSEENRLWFEFIKKEKSYKKQKKDLEVQINYFQTQEDSYYTPERRKTLVSDFNRLQKERDSLILSLCAKYPEKLVTCLITCYREPFLDGNTSLQERKDEYKASFYKTFSTHDERLIYSPVYTEKTFAYLMSYAEAGLPKKAFEDALKPAVDSILFHASSNDRLYDFVLDYLIRGFEKLDLMDLQVYLAENYSVANCESDEQTTLKRRLTARRMLPGMQMPDFTMEDRQGQTWTLSHIAKEKTLLVFWASWCNHCSEMLPKLKNYLEQMEDIEVVYVSLDEDKSAWQQAITDLDASSGYHLCDFQFWDSEVAEAYSVYATPTFFLLDKERVLIKRVASVEKLINK